MLWSRTSYAFVRSRNIPTTCRRWSMAFKLLTQIAENSINNCDFFKVRNLYSGVHCDYSPQVPKKKATSLYIPSCNVSFRTGYLNIRNWRKLGGRLILRILVFKIHSPPCWKIYKVGSEQADRRQWPWGLCVSENVWVQNKGEGEVTAIFCSKKRCEEI